MTPKPEQTGLDNPIIEELPRVSVKTDANGHSEGSPQSVLPIRPKKHSGWLNTWRLPLLCALVCAITAFIISTIVPKMYRAETTLYFPSGGDSSASSMIGALGGNGRMSLPGSGGGNVSLNNGIVTSPQIANGPNTAMAVLSSRRCRIAVIDACRLQDRWSGTMAQILTRLDKNVSYSIDKNGLLAIEVTDHNPKLASIIAQSYLDTLKQISTELSINISRRNRIFLEGRLRTVRVQLHDQQSQLARLQKRVNEVNPLNADETHAAGAYADLQSQQEQAKIDLASVDARIQWETRAAHVTAHNDMNLPMPVLAAQQSRARLRSLEADFAVAQSTLGPDNPNYRLLKLQVQSARSQMQAEIRREMSAVQNGIAPQVATLYGTRASLQARLEGLNQAVARVQSNLVTMPTSMMMDQRLTAHIKTGMELEAMLQSELERAREAEVRDESTFVVVDPPAPPDEPYTPRRSFVTMFALIVGLLIGAAWRAGKTIMQQSETLSKLP